MAIWTCPSGADDPDEFEITPVLDPAIQGCGDAAPLSWETIGLPSANMMPFPPAT